MPKLKDTNYDKTKKNQTVNKTFKLKLWQNSKTEIITKPKQQPNSKTQIAKLNTSNSQELKTWITTKLNYSNWTKLSK